MWLWFTAYQNGPNSVDKKVSEYKSSKRTELAIANGLPIDTNAKEMVSQDKIKERLLNEIDDVKWSKMMILYIISVLLCPKAHLDASIKYLPLLEEGFVRQFTNYNWCQYVVDHFHKGFKKAKNNLKKGTTQMFVGADINLLMQQPILDWLEMAKRVIEDEIIIVKQSMKSKMGENIDTAIPTSNKDPISPPSPNGDTENVTSPRMTPQFNLGIDEPFSQEIPKEHLADPIIVEDAHPEIEIKRPKCVVQKSKMLLSPYTPIKYVKKKGQGKAKSDPKPPMTTINEMERSLIDYARNKDLLEAENIRRKANGDLTLNRLQLKTLNYNEPIVTDVIDAYIDLLNDQELAEHKERPRRWVFPTYMVEIIHAGVNAADAPDSVYMSAVLTHLAKYKKGYLALVECEFVLLHGF
ncbi:hypothetical protein LINPERPRIM_LOCUS27816 [Linum perenne]